MGRGLRGALASATTRSRTERADLGQEDYRLGHCDAFALALHRKTGWPILKIAARPNEAAWHFMIQHPSGHVVDGDGVRGLDEVLEEHDYEELPEPDCFEASLDELINYQSDTEERAVAARGFVEAMPLD